MVGIQCNSQDMAGCMWLAQVRAGLQLMPQMRKGHVLRCIHGIVFGLSDRLSLIIFVHCCDIHCLVQGTCNDVMPSCVREIWTLVIWHSRSVADTMAQPVRVTAPPWRRGHSCRYKSMDLPNDTVVAALCTHRTKKTPRIGTRCVVLSDSSGVEVRANDSLANRALIRFLIN